MAVAPAVATTEIGVFASAGSATVVAGATAASRNPQLQDNIKRANGLAGQVSKYVEKLGTYSTNPHAYDNKGFLSGCPKERFSSIYEGRIKRLQQSIEVYIDQIRNLRGL